MQCVFHKSFFKRKASELPTTWYACVAFSCRYLRFQPRQDELAGGSVVEDYPESVLHRFNVYLAINFFLGVVSVICVL